LRRTSRHLCVMPSHRRKERTGCLLLSAPALPAVKLLAGKYSTARQCPSRREGLVPFSQALSNLIFLGC
jgi:hypothetical protein